MADKVWRAGVAANSRNIKHHENDCSSQTVTARCHKCHSDIGEFYNNFFKVTRSYAIPALAGSYTINPDTVGSNGKVKQAQENSELAGCEITPLSCRCGETLGLLCVRAPTTKATFVGRELFKIPKLSFFNEAGDQTEALDEDGRLLSGGEVKMVSAPEADPRDGLHAATTGDFTSKLPSAKQLIAASLSPRDRDLPDIARRRDTGPSPNPQAENRDVLQLQPPSYRRDHVVPINSSPVDNHPHGTNGMRRQQVLAPGSAPTQSEMEAAQRVQNEAHYYRLVDLHTRDITTLGEMLSQIEHNVQMLIRDMHSVRQELHNRAGTAAPAANTDDRTLEVFSSNLSQVANKANEVDGIKVELALLKRKVARLEDQSQITSPTTVNGPFSHRESVSQAPAPASGSHHQHSLPTIPPISTLASPHHAPDRRVIQTPGGPVVVEYPDPRAAEHRRSGPSMTSTHTLDPETPASAVGGGWTTVNQGAKRPSDASGRVDMSGTPIGSPKRPKLAPLEPRLPSSESMHHASSFEDSRELPHPRPHSTESYLDSTKAHPAHPGYPSMQDAHADDNWRTEPHGPMHGGHSAGTSPRRGGRGGRGRGRRSGQEHELMSATPEWERDQSWNSTQVGPDGYYQQMTPGGRGRGVLRRESGGVHSIPGTQLPPGQTVMMQPGDPYAHTKKQRQKPTRNANGILIRKDGRPDMRSQSSAANLRKVHARKEEERQREWEATQTSGSPTVGNGPFSSMNNDSARASRSASADSQDVAEAQIQGEKTEEQQRHEQVMKQMFPRGVDESRSIYGFGGGDGERRPAALSRQQSGESMHVDETQPSTAAASKLPTPEPPMAGNVATAAMTAVDSSVSQDAHMKDAERPVEASVEAPETSRSNEAEAATNAA